MAAHAWDQQWVSVATEIRKDFLAVGRVVRESSLLLCAMDLIDIATNVCPSGRHLMPSVEVLPCLGFPGGRLFGFYMFAFASDWHSKQLLQQTELEGPTAEQWDQHLTRQTYPFYSFVGNRLYAMSRSFDHQMMFRTILAEGKGLSKQGRIIFSRLGYILAETTYRRRMEKELNEQEELLR